jgi:hypothetical protein
MHVSRPARHAFRDPTLVGLGSCSMPRNSRRVAPRSIQSSANHDDWRARAALAEKIVEVFVDLRERITNHDDR